MVICLQQFYEIIEEELRVDRTAACFRMELCREPRIRFVSNALVRSVVHIDEQRFPIAWKRVVVNGIAVVLAGDEAAVRAHHTHWLVVAAVSVFQFVDRRSGRF